MRIRYIEEIEQPLREEISDLRQRLAQEQVGGLQRLQRLRT